MKKNNTNYYNLDENFGAITEDASILRKIEEQLRNVFNKHKISEILVPSFEYSDIYKQLCENFEEKRAFEYILNSGKKVSLIWDYTIPIAKHYCIQNNNKQAKYSYFGKVYRKEPKYKGRNIEEYQAGIELINIESDGDKECINILQETLNLLNIENIKIEFGSRKLFNRIYELVGCDKKIIEILSQKNISEMKKYLSNKKIDDRLKDFLLKLPRLSGSIKLIDMMIKEVSDEVILEALLDLKKMYEIIMQKDNIIFDLAMCPSMDYYSGIMFKVYCPEVSKPLICGGRYDSLYEKFGKNVKAIGMAYYINNIIKALESEVRINDKNGNY